MERMRAEAKRLVKTKKGVHRYYRHPGATIRNRARVVTPDGQLNLDVRGDRGYVLAPGSVHPSGCLYLAEGNWSVPWEELPIFDERWFIPNGGTSPKSVPLHENASDVVCLVIAAFPLDRRRHSGE